MNRGRGRRAGEVGGTNVVTHTSKQYLGDGWESFVLLACNNRGKAQNNLRKFVQFLNLNKHQE